MKELRRMDNRTRKVVTMHKVLHPFDDTEKFFVSKKVGGTGAASIDICDDATIHEQERYRKKRKERLITANSKTNINILTTSTKLT